MTTTTIERGLWASPIAPYAHRVRQMALGMSPFHVPEVWDDDLRRWVKPLAVASYFATADYVWVGRERDRQRRQPVPAMPLGTVDRYPEHFVYLSAEGGMIGYTPDYLYGRADRQVRMKPGKYLAKYYPEIPAHVAAEWVHACAPKEVTISQDADVIADVYFNGPHSCQHPESDHANEYVKDWANHPCRMYAGPDCGIAYLGDRKSAIARTVVWLDKKVYVRVYGEQSLGARLEALGYSEGRLDGARCQLRRDGERVIVPYVDGASYGSECDGFLVLSECRGEWYMKETCGYVNEEQYYCSREDCSNTCDEDERYCSSCMDAHWCCDDCGDDFFGYDNRNGESHRWCDSCYANRITRCEGCDDTFCEEDLTCRTRQARARGDWALAYCPDCASDRYECAECGDVCENDSPCCASPDDDDGDDSETTDSTPETGPTVADVAGAQARSATLAPGQTVVSVGCRDTWAAPPGQIGTVSHIANGYAHIVWDRRSGTTQADGGYLATIRLATEDDIRAYEMSVSPSRRIEE